MLREDVEALDVRRVDGRRHSAQAAVVPSLDGGPLLQEEGHELVVAAVARDL